MRFEAYLPPALADWLLAQIERGTFRDPSEAVFVIFGEHEELEPHSDLRQELLKRSLQAALDDPRPGIPAEEVFSKLRARMQEPCASPAVWRKLPRRAAVILSPLSAPAVFPVRRFAPRPKDAQRVVEFLKQ